jgi:hypothetical protein
MHDTVWTGEPRPGTEPGDEEAFEGFSAATLGYLGRGEEAERHARASLALVEGSGHFRRATGTYLALARAFIRRATPDPEQAAAALQDALRTADGNEGNTLGRAAAVARQITANPDWARLPAVRDLAAQLPDRRLLTAGATV